ncbi:MAG: GTP-binding protein, partial [Candidatus Lokiarchaeota archaeon]|nr:GTP-binding protein [Candidatus Lokiarchaeota archaeon]
MIIKFKVIVAGAKNVGKTSLIRRYATGKFDRSTLSTIGVDFETKKVVVDGNEILLNIWDFAGEKKFRLLLPSYVSGASGALILYDITNKDSLEDLHDWVNVITSVPNYPKTRLLIEAKIDLESQREVKQKDAKELLDKYKFQGNIYGVSSKTGENVEEAFLYVVKKIVKRNLQICRICGEVFNKKLKNCQYCGAKVEDEI